MHADRLSRTSLSNREWGFLLIIFGLAVGLRATYLLQIKDNPFFDHPRLDALFHDRWAQTVASGDVVGDKVFFRAPAYPYFLGALYAIFGHNYVVPRVAQQLIGAVGLVLLYLLARRMFGIPVAVVASILCSFYAVLVYFEGELLFESLLVFACMVWLLMVRTHEGTSFRRSFFLGIVYGIICCIRPPFLAIAPFLFLGLAWRYIKSGTRLLAVRTILALSLGCLLVILPIAIRNYVVGRDIVLIASQGGINFYIGNNPGANGHSSMMPESGGASWENRDQTYIVEKALGHAPSPSEESWFWYQRGLQFLIQHPTQYLSLLVKKLYLFWNWYEIPNNQSFSSFTKYSTLLRILPVGFWMVGPLGLMGMIMAWRKKREYFSIAFVILYTSVIVLFFVCDRFRLPVVPVLCIFAAYALVSILGIIKERNWRDMAIAGAILTGCAIVVNSNLYPIEKDTTARDFLALGIVNLDKGDYPHAIEAFERSAAAHKTPPPNLLLNWGVAEWFLGRTEEAIRKFHEELVYYPNSYPALNNLSYSHLSLGRPDSAILYGTIATRVKPYLPRAYLAIALAYQREKDLHSAATILETGIGACGAGFFRGQLMLAETYKEMGRIDAAESIYRQVLCARTSSSQPAYEPEINFVNRDLPEDDAVRLHAEAAYGLGHVWAARRNPDSSLFYFQRAVGLSPRYADAWADVGVAFMQTRRFAEADSALRQAIALAPQNHLYWFNYGTLLGIRGHLQEAEIAFQKTLELRPDFQPAKEKIDLTRKLLPKMRTER